MQTIKTNGREIVAVEVPMYSFDYYITKDCVGATDAYGGQFYDWFSEKFDTTECVILGLLSELTAEQCEPYLSDFLWLSPQINLRRMLTANGIDMEKPLLIIEKLK